jgi:hypothetical protein
LVLRRELARSFRAAWGLFAVEAVFEVFDSLTQCGAQFRQAARAEQENYDKKDQNVAEAQSKHAGFLTQWDEKKSADT